MSGSFMEIVILRQEEMYRGIAEMHNPPLVRNQKEENVFQAEVLALYRDFVTSLSFFGEEGDYYGVSDFTVSPVLRNYPTAAPAPHVREFSITVLTEKFFRSDYLTSVHEFLTNKASSYRIYIEQEFNPHVHLRMFLTAQVARVYCSNDEWQSEISNKLAVL